MKALMNFLRAYRVWGLATLALFLSESVAAQGQGNYPNRPVKLIVPFAAGSAADGLARVVAAQLAEQWGQPVVIDNKAGAGGTIGTSAIAKAVPDGYTIGLAAQGTLINNQALYAKPGYDSLKDFSPIATVAEVQNVLAVAPSAPYQNAAELLSEIKNKPAEAFSFSSSGVGTSHHVAGVVLGQYLNKPLLHVAYTGAPQGISAIMAGDVDLGLYNIPAAIGQVRGSRLRALAVTGLSRSPLLPNVPTLDESGLKGFEVKLWFGFIAPAGMPSEIVSRLHGELNKVMSRLEIRSKFTEQGYTLSPVPLAPPAEFRSLIARDLDMWLPVMKKIAATAK
jgi:tripartite-type tricarboxylate transporter receptor subunit TctC